MQFARSNDGHGGRGPGSVPYSRVYALSRSARATAPAAVRTPSLASTRASRSRTGQPEAVERVCAEAAVTTRAVWGKRPRGPPRARLDQENLVHATGLASIQISRIERGIREVRLTTLIRLLTALDVP